MSRGCMQFVGGEWVDGVMVGREAAMAESAWRKEKREFAALCNNLYWRKWRKEHPEQARAYVAKWARTHRAAVKAKKIRWQRNHPEAHAEYQRAYNRDYYKRNRAALLAYQHERWLRSKTA